MREKKIIIIFSSFFLICCGSSKSICNENLQFKRKFTENIETVEKYVNGRGYRNEFKEALSFISKYSEVSYLEMLNYGGSYSSYAIFQKDKQKWLQWYEENKCNNIQF
jgi:hypothetical protein